MEAVIDQPLGDVVDSDAGDLPGRPERRGAAPETRQDPDPPRRVRGLQPLGDTTRRLKEAFDRDGNVKKFFKRFEKELPAFRDFIAGVQELADREWYASLMINRLMFVYFVQKKGFLNGDRDYLRSRLALVKAGNFHTFYRYFLKCLFHEGFAKEKGDRKLDKELAKLLGEVPYLNGGLFDVHDLERRNPDADIPDEAFDRLFRFFEDFDWHLDNRPLRKGNEINPDVLGHIFEKYINQKQMGAYYTKEDITDYIGRNTIIPRLFDAAEAECAVAFEPGAPLWRLLSENPDSYLYPAMRKGVIDPEGEEIPLPAEIAAGVADVAQRGGWNRAAAEAYALPTETWREHVARRTRCLEIRRKLRDGEISRVNDLITYNLDIRRFAQDAVAQAEGSNFVEAFYNALRKVTVLDPTCGSGAFLFAALNILQPLYEACLDRMVAFVADSDAVSPPFTAGKTISPPFTAGKGTANTRHECRANAVNPPFTAGKGTANTRHECRANLKYRGFREILAEADLHPNREYFVLKTAIVHNLYGVDIMEEAVEICKLRLFLKLASCVEADPGKKNFGIEPLPDIDFNIRAGNTLVDFATFEEVQKAVAKDKMDYDDEAGAIREAAAQVQAEFANFQKMQLQGGAAMKGMADFKAGIRRSLDKLRDRLDRALAGLYGVRSASRGAMRVGKDLDQAGSAVRASPQPMRVHNVVVGLHQGDRDLPDGDVWMGAGLR